ncbi:hypothetical protein [Nannocystis pusilla]
MVKNIAAPQEDRAAFAAYGDGHRGGPDNPRREDARFPGIL